MKEVVRGVMQIRRDEKGAVVYVNPLGEEYVPPDPVFTNPNDPVSPQQESEAVGAGPAYPDGILYAFPDDPSLEVDLHTYPEQAKIKPNPQPTTR